MNFTIWAGSSVLKKPLLKSGLKALKQIGFEYEMSKTVEKYAVLNKQPLLPSISGNDSLRLQEFLKILANPAARWVLATRGGYGCIRLLDALDKTSIERAAPLHIWGYSDLTALQLYLWQRKGWSYVQGPLLGSDSLTAPSPKEQKIYKHISRFGIFPSVFPLLRIGTKASAPKGPILLLGGNLATIVSMIGTPWEPKPSTEFLLFLEDIEEPSYKSDRLLQQLLYSRMFESCRGIVLGHFTRCSDYKKVFTGFGRQAKIPIYGGLPMGHEAPRIPLVMGDLVLVDKNRLILSNKSLIES